MRQQQQRQQQRQQAENHHHHHQQQQQQPPRFLTLFSVTPLSPFSLETHSSFLSLIAVAVVVVVSLVLFLVPTEQRSESFIKRKMTMTAATESSAVSGVSAVDDDHDHDHDDHPLLLYKVIEIPGRGKALVATKDLEPGVLGLTILQEAPLMVSPIRAGGENSSSSSSSGSSSSTTIKNKLQHSPQLPQQEPSLRLLDDKSGPLPAGKLSNFLNPQFWTDYWAYQQQPIWVQTKIKQHYYDRQEVALYQKAIDMVLPKDLQPPINTPEFATVIMVFRYNAATVTGIGT
jgi:hypothetical protein